MIVTKGKSNKKNQINETFSYGIIYIYSIPDIKHKGRLKIGAATTGAQNPTQTDIEAAAHERIGQQTKTADIPYTLEYAELAVTEKGNFFSDYQIHEVLKRSGYERKSESGNSHSEWFEIDLNIAKSAIRAVKEGRTALETHEKIIVTKSSFSFRPNQRAAIDATTEAIRKKRHSFLWNAKMRFGKTSAAMQVAKENKMQKVLIVTHRPSVSADWFDDFNQIFGDTNYQFSSKTKGENIGTLVKGTKSFVYFASLQDLRLSKRVVGDDASGSKAQGFDKNDEVFDTTWDMLIVDEAHEGTQSQLGDSTLEKIQKNFSLYLSGTPFNILHKQEEEDVYTWDYVMEQEAKLNWDEEHSGVPNPYAELPALSIFTYEIDTFKNHIGDFGSDFKDALDGAFKFHEFFRVKKDEDGNDTAEFVHKEMVKKFLDLLVNDSLATKFPYATEQYRNYNKHSLWLLPNRVKVIEAMEKLLGEHSVFGTGNFGIVNISGNNHDDDEDKDAKDKVVKAIQKYDYTITLTGQRLTTGASIKEWTAVFMMSDTSSATTYLQTAFRCQTPATDDGKIKTQGYVFDFAPDRTLRLIAEAVELNHKAGKINSLEQKEAMEKFLNFCPILAASSGSMKPYDVSGMLNQLKRAIAERVYRSGFEDPKLYNDELLQLSEVDIKKFNELRALVGASNTKATNEIKINELGLDGPLLIEAEKAERKTKTELTEKQKEALKKLQEARKQKQSAISVLRAVSIRMPMLVYGADVSIREDITLNRFIELVDEESWREFMPVGLTKGQFRDFTKYYDEDVFKGVAHSIRAKAFDCDELLPTERVQAIAEIFSTFKNPDKETVLTPWNVVNMHLTKAFGGHDFTSGEKDKTGKPVWVSKDVDTSVWEQEDTRILEINSKSGMYPLLAAYNIYTRKLKHSKKPEEKIAHDIWKQVLEENVYVLCKSPMAKSITLRTLVGYRKDTHPNIVYVENLVEKLQRKGDFKDYELQDELLEKFELSKDMKFTAVVGNPPYQVQTRDTSDNPIYHLFIDEAYKLSEKVALIHPARFLFNAGKTPKEWNRKMLDDQHVTCIFYESNSSKVFSHIDIKGGVAITYRDRNRIIGPIGKFSTFQETNSILNKIEKDLKKNDFSRILYTQNKFNLKKLYKNYPEYKKIIGSDGREKRLTTGIFEQLEVFSPASESGKVQVLGLTKNKRVYKYIDHNYLETHLNLKKYKVFIAKSNGSGKYGEVLSAPTLGRPGTGYTQSFISAGSFSTLSEAENCLKFLKTKFCRALLGTLKVTQDNPKNVWKNIPLQDFTSNSDLNWSKSIAELDRQLYKKYNFTKEEIDFIEKHVRPMT